MRTIRVSKTYLAALHGLLAFGQARFGSRVVDEKRALVSHTISEILAVHPAIGAFDEALGVYFHPASRTPFVLLYDFDDAELRIHLIIHRSRLDLSDVRW